MFSDSGVPSHHARRPASRSPTRDARYRAVGQIVIELARNRAITCAISSHCPIRILNNGLPLRKCGAETTRRQARRIAGGCPLAPARPAIGISVYAQAGIPRRRQARSGTVSLPSDDHRNPAACRFYIPLSPRRDGRPRPSLSFGDARLTCATILRANVGRPWHGGPPGPIVRSSRFGDDSSSRSRRVK